MHGIRIAAVPRRHLEAVMRQEHRAGEKLFVDFAVKRPGGGR